MGENPNLAVRLFLDALDDLVRAVDDLTPEAAQTRPSDQLNSISWVVAHVAQHADSWVNVAIGHKARVEFLWQPQFTTGAAGDPPAWRDVAGALTEVVRHAKESVAALGSAELIGGTPYTGGISALQGKLIRPEYRLARLTAHVYTHIGEILATRSMLRLDVGSFPGAMPETMTGRVSGD